MKVVDQTNGEDIEGKQRPPEGGEQPQAAQGGAAE
jgi:hypothetical protein